MSTVDLVINLLQEKLGVRRFVFPEGPDQPDIALIGEAGGEKEKIFQRPFVGNVGSELNRMLSSAGIQRQLTYLTNVIKEHPPENDIKKFITITSTGKVIETPEFKIYQSILKEELLSLSPNVAVACGGVALWALCNKTGITKWRGSILESTLIPGLKVIPVVHPSNVYKDWRYRYDITLDLMNIKEESHSKEISIPIQHVRVITNILDVSAVLSDINNLSKVSFDIETVRQQLYSIAFSYMPNSAWVIPFMLNGANIWTEAEEIMVMQKIAAILENPKILKIGQFIIFDASFLFRHYGIRTTNIADTMIAHTIIAPDFPHGLDYITSRYTRQPYYKDEGKQWNKITNEQGFLRYNGIDAIVTAEAFPKLLEDVEKLNNKPTYERHISIIDPLIFMQEHGIKVDIKSIAAEKERLEGIVSVAKQQFIQQTGVTNPASTKEIMNYFYIVRKLTPYKNKATGNPTCDVIALKRIARKGFEEASLLLTIRRAEKAISTFLSVDFGEDNRLRCSFSPITKQGRLASSKSIFGEGTNMQNQPRYMKKFLLADPGYLAVTMDLSQAENRIVAYIAPEPRMIRAFEQYDVGAGPSVHNITAGYIFNKNPEDVSDEPGSADSIGNGELSERDWGKRANHGFNYGLGADKFSLINEIPIIDAKKIRNTYFNAYPGVDQMHRWIEAKLNSDRILHNVFGRARKFLSPALVASEAFSFIPQSTVADIINERGLAFIWNNFPEVVLLNQVHDSVVFQVPVSLGAEKILQIIKRIKTELEISLTWQERTFVIPVDTKIGINLEGVKLKVLDESFALATIADQISQSALCG